MKCIGSSWNENIFRVKIMTQNFTCEKNEFFKLKNDWTRYAICDFLKKTKMKTEKTTLQFFRTRFVVFFETPVYFFLVFHG
jgi:hypothetical protein